MYNSGRAEPIDVYGRAEQKNLGTKELYDIVTKHMEMAKL
jgi:hypothetical protein